MIGPTFGGFGKAAAVLKFNSTLAARTGAPSAHRLSEAVVAVFVRPTIACVYADVTRDDAALKRTDLGALATGVVACLVFCAATAITGAHAVRTRFGVAVIARVAKKAASTAYAGPGAIAACARGGCCRGWIVRA